MSPKWFFIPLLFTCLLMISGCWSHRELTDLAIVSAMAIDKNEEGRYVITIQVINPGNVASGLQGGGGQNPPVSNYSITGDTILESSRRLSKKISRIRYYAHTNLIVISEKLAREDGITKIFDAVERSPEFRTTAKVVIAHNANAADIANTLTPIDKIPANQVIKTLNFTEKVWGELINVNVQDVIKNLVTPGKEPVITGFHLVGNPKDAKKMENIQETTPSGYLGAFGLATFKDGKLIDWFQNEKARGVSWTLDKIKTTVITVNWKKEKEGIAFEVIHQKTKVKTDMVKGHPEIFIHTEVEGNIGEVSVPVNLSNPDILLKIEKEVEKDIKKEINLAVQQAKKNQSDIFGFGEAVHMSHPKAWKDLKQDWNEVYFPQVKVHVSANAFVRRSGISNKSYLSDVENN
jgi:spore germination protein KC